MSIDTAIQIGILTVGVIGLIAAAAAAIRMAFSAHRDLRERDSLQQNEIDRINRRLNDHDGDRRHIDGKFSELSDRISRMEGRIMKQLNGAGSSH